MTRDPVAPRIVPQDRAERVRHPPDCVCGAVAGAGVVCVNPSTQERAEKVRRILAQHQHPVDWQGIAEGLARVLARVPSDGCLGCGAEDGPHTPRCPIGEYERTKEGR